ncbi:hypothetical protein CSOJ01_15682 [Colletotrichum sojae]|uniref:Uncharacterized protein n=1 Tax=Colletotrichum sojae TaxID=2175907 RepID=A0A8H6MIA2_9PEZI|nr:hypothetical protein CSOJ01_15682 [Colletotrichum sojae]
MRSRIIERVAFLDIKDRGRSRAGSLARIASTAELVDDRCHHPIAPIRTTPAAPEHHDPPLPRGNAMATATSADGAPMATRTESLAQTSRAGREPDNDQLFYDALWKKLYTDRATNERATPDLRWDPRATAGAEYDAVLAQALFRRPNTKEELGVTRWERAIHEARASGLPRALEAEQWFPSLVQSIGSSGLEHWIASNASTVEDEALDNTLSVGEVITKIRRRPRNIPDQTPRPRAGRGAFGLPSTAPIRRDDYEFNHKVFIAIVYPPRRHYLHYFQRRGPRDHPEGRRNHYNPHRTLLDSQPKQEISAPPERNVFDIVPYDAKNRGGVQLFKLRIVNEIKAKPTNKPYEKSRPVIQGYADDGKTEILTQSLTIKRASQGLILGLAPSLIRDSILCLRDITQAYTQSETILNRTILA